MQNFKTLSFWITACVMFGFWIMLSGDFHSLLVGSGVVSSLFVAYISHDYFVGGLKLFSLIKRVLRFLGYLPWLLWQIALANVDLVYRVLHPGMPIDPKIIKFKVDLKSDAGITILANSITLTPGTVTIEAGKHGEFVVHAIADEAAASLTDGTMQGKVKKVEGKK
ncbi:Na+/H+ antiporter subunit E [Elusimicrobiota bacterium]